MIPSFTLFSFATSDFNFKQPTLSNNQTAFAIKRGNRLQYFYVIHTSPKALTIYRKNTEGGLEVGTTFEPGSYGPDETPSDRCYGITFDSNGKVEYVDTVSIYGMVTAYMPAFIGPFDGIAIYGAPIIPPPFTSVPDFPPFNPSFSGDNDKNQVINSINEVKSELQKSSTPIPTVDNSTYGDIQGVEDSIPGIDLNQFKSILHNLDTDSFRQSSAWIWQQVENWTMVSPLVLTFLMVLLTFSLIAYLLRKV